MARERVFRNLLRCVLLQPFDRIKTIVQQETTKNLLTIIRVVPGVTLYFNFLNIAQTFVPKDLNAHLSNLFLGFFSRSLVCTLLMPPTVIKTRLESNIYKDSNLFSVAKELVRQYGIAGLFKGSLPTILRDAPFSEGKDFSPLSRFVCGIIAGISACILTQPFDFIKTQMQLYPGKYRSFIQIIEVIYSKGNFSRFFCGFWLRAIRRTLMAAINWTIFDETAVNC
ncbi:unnamed protein product [Dracunculus medinensis]|uniref:Solute carrier family 25 member 51 n=1 Tax=Dracunculus medinensis TaxID=318479 RepID=A0A0N4U3U2_DRAME|nr:unnamed protein product [Dracunculus medinensis]